MESVIPKSEKEITAEWIHKHTGMKPVEGTILVDGNIQTGVGFLSNLCRVSFDKEDGSKEHILVKLLPEDPEYLALTIDQKFDQIEIKFYNLVKPEILKISPELEVNMVKDYGGSFEGSDDGANYRSMIIMEDLKPAGYKMLDPNSENSDRNLQKVLEFLAKFHVTGCALEKKKNAKISQLYPFCLGVDDSNLNLLLHLAVTNEVKLQRLLKKFNCPEDILSSYDRINGKSEEIMYRVLKKGAEFPCLIHGDVWPPNVMVAEIDDPVKIIDWQLLGYRDPVYDITPLILTCIKKQSLDNDVIEKFARFYYSEFLKASEMQGLGVAQERNEAEFVEFFNTWGMAYGFIWLILSIDSFPNDEERLYLGFKLLHEKYDIVNVLLNEEK